MSVWSQNLAIYQWIGLWRPIHWSFGWKYFCYNIYTYFSLFIMSFSVFTEMVKLIGSFESIKQLLRNSTILLTMIGNCVKAINIVDKRKDIDKLLNTLITYPCCPQNLKEKSIQDEYNRIIRFRTTSYVILVGTAISATVMKSVFCDLSEKSLPFKAWYPFDVSISYYYYTAWLHQILAHIFGAITSASYDTFVSGLMLQSCAKFDIFDHRLCKSLHDVCDNLQKLKINEEKQILEQISKCAEFHLKIIEFSNFTNDVVSSVILIQFLISTQVICVTVYGLSKTKLDDPNFPVLATYLVCMLLQLFLFCYAGSELTLKSEEVAISIYCNANWYSSSINVQKYLLMIMKCSSYVVKFTCGTIIDLSIDSYTRVVKLSYSIYNVLQ